MRFSILVLSLSLSNYCFSRERIYLQNDQSYLIVADYLERGKYVGEVFRKYPGKFQRLTYRGHFNDPEIRQKALQSFTSGNHQEIFLQRSAPTSFSEVTGEINWPASHSWDWTWELRFADWIRSEVNADFFQKHKIPIDCADLYFGLRWIFSRIFELPAAFLLAGGIDLFTHESLLTEWKDLPSAANWWEDQRFLASLEYLLQNTYTQSLVNDSYPIAISREALIPGAFILRLTEDSGHLNMIGLTQFDGNPDNLNWIGFWAATVPRRLRKIDYLIGFQSPNYPRAERQEGFLRTRWPERDSDGGWILRKAHEMPFHSEEQYYPSRLGGYERFGDAVYSRVQGIAPPIKSRFTALLFEIIERFKARQEIVLKGYDFCSKNECLEGTSEYDNWSTPNRDLVILELVTIADRLLKESPGETQPIYKKYKDEIVVRVGRKQLLLKRLISIWLSNSYSSNPNDSIERRWGL